MILFKKWSKDKGKSYVIYCVTRFLRMKRHKIRAKNVNKNSLYCSMFVIFFTFRLLEPRI